jgi:EAL domain-containing protein (putative c-di-GMP-specific phosphodiesterase class I)
MGEWVLREGCRQAKAWLDKGLAPRSMAINLSARQFSDKGFLEMVSRILEETGLDPKWLELEITGEPGHAPDRGMIMLLNQLSEMGIQLAIDDFGTATRACRTSSAFRSRSSRSTSRSCATSPVDPNDTAIVVAIINMARSLELETIAEGVETAGQLALPALEGLPHRQGFYFSRPARPKSLLRDARAEQRLRAHAAPSAAD